MRQLLILVVGLCVTASLTAQNFEIKPGPEHAFLKEGVGTWEAVAKSQGKESKGLLHCEMNVNGLWLLEHYKGDVGGTAFEGHGGTSYDPATKKYTNVWIDSMTTRPMVSEGTYDKEKKTLTFKGDMPMPDGKTIKSTITINYKDANTKVLSVKGSAEGKELEFIEITYKRRGK